MKFEITNLPELEMKIEKIVDLDMNRINKVLNDNNDYVVGEEFGISEDLPIGYMEAVNFKTIKANENHVVLTYIGTFWV
ncbi:hypothetical protein [Listeria seeligeri]|uniref:hypothetical protein n=1 Tax=Listeria seeligeri TaxID=1640 RepID=UPI0022EBB0E8|nr:hypothetical protein [Listeria seeligeri]